MATNTPLRHPLESSQTLAFCAYEVQVFGFDVDGARQELYSGPCAMDPNTSTAGSAVLEAEHKSPGELLIPSWDESITTASTAVISYGGATRRVKVNAVIPQGPGPDQMLLIVSAEE